MTSQDLPKALTSYFQNAPVALALADATDDHPLLMINERFTRLTGYGPEDAVGHNCRFLQGEAKNPQARVNIHRFLETERQPSVRTPIVNFRKNGEPFVNLLFMTKLRSTGNKLRYVFASQFDISRSHPELLEEYEVELDRTMTQLSPVLAESGVVLEGTLSSLANTASTIAQAKLTLAELEGGYNS
ncbi:PAS domain-containing protein [Pararhizobium mangrovi]|uniref:PAS domain-containing protein n=1 Tax=Pararhizobium mangrovi TaxID=2590452 RepID=A0A506TXU9_9HYPH|nr:PAS domain-containing protein [Pararhizobium mangrovi]TPW26136.1 PAS domain-containing protein [Pararhizobium mangrovi]